MRTCTSIAMIMSMFNFTERASDVWLDQVRRVFVQGTRIHPRPPLCVCALRFLQPTLCGEATCLAHKAESQVNTSKHYRKKGGGDVGWRQVAVQG